ncbi:MAG: zinc-binding dehydrogenase [Streptosporangiaceae bacterium]
MPGTEPVEISKVKEPNQLCELRYSRGRERSRWASGPIRSSRSRPTRSPHAAGSIGHEFIGVVEQAGADVHDVRVGDLVVAPFIYSGAVGLCAVLAARRLGAGRIIALSRHPDRQTIAREFGATDIVETRGEEASQAVLELTGGIGADAVLECVGTAQSIATAFAAARPGSVVGIVGVPHGQPPFAQAFFRNTGWRGGPAPARIYIPELLGDVLDGTINPGLVFDYETGLDHIADAYKAMDERRAIKSLIRIGAL